MKRLSLLILGSLVALSGCSSVKDTLGMERTTPDEFAVVERAPLTVPPNFDLVAPQPGALRPQDNTESSAKGLVLGSQSSAPKAANGSRAEQALLSRAGTVQAAPEIRQELSKPDEPVKPKTVAEKLGMTGDAEERGTALDPVIEAKRLDQIKINSTPITEEPVDSKPKAKNAK
jgi:hypothetical protein